MAGKFLFFFPALSVAVAPPFCVYVSSRPRCRRVSAVFAKKKKKREATPQTCIKEVEGKKKGRGHRGRCSCGFGASRQRIPGGADRTKERGGEGGGRSCSNRSIRTGVRGVPYCLDRAASLAVLLDSGPRKTHVFSRALPSSLAYTSLCSERGRPASFFATLAAADGACTVYVLRQAHSLPFWIVPINRLASLFLRPRNVDAQTIKGPRTRPSPPAGEKKRGCSRSLDNSGQTTETGVCCFCVCVFEQPHCMVVDSVVAAPDVVISYVLPATRVWPL